MLSILANRTYRHLFAAQVIALLGTGLATVALGLLAWNIAGDDAGVVLGTALAIKMVAYVTLAPVASALAVQVPRRTMLVGLAVLRAVVAVAHLSIATVRFSSATASHLCVGSFMRARDRTSLINPDA